MGQPIQDIQLKWNLHATLGGCPITFSFGTIFCVVCVAACQWNTEAPRARGERVTRWALLVADALAFAVVWPIRRRASQVTDALAPALIEHVVSGTPGIFGTSFHALTRGLIEDVTFGASTRSMWAGTAARTIVVDLVGFANWSVGTHALALGLIECVMDIGAFCNAAFTSASLGVKHLMCWAEFFLADARA